MNKEVIYSIDINGIIKEVDFETKQRFDELQSIEEKFKDVKNYIRIEKLMINRFLSSTNYAENPIPGLGDDIKADRIKFKAVLNKLNSIEQKITGGEN